MSRRHKHASTVLTSSKGFEEWGDVFDDEAIAAAVVDRLLHHCHIVNIRGNSCPMRPHRHLALGRSEPDPEPARRRRHQER